MITGLLDCSGNPANPIILRIPIQTNSRLFRLLLVLSPIKLEPFSPPAHTHPAWQTWVYERSISHTWSEFGLIRWIDYWIVQETKQCHNPKDPNLDFKQTLLNLLIFGYGKVKIS